MFHLGVLSVLLIGTTTTESARIGESQHQTLSMQENQKANLWCNKATTCEQCMGATSEWTNDECDWCEETKKCRSTWDIMMGTRCTGNFFEPMRGWKNTCPAGSASMSGMRQPATTASSWFLSESEITRSRGGVARSLCNAWSSGNVVEMLPVGKDVFTRWMENLNNAGNNDFAYISSWLIGPNNLALDPLSDDIDSTRLENVWKAAINKGVRCLALPWRNQIEDGPPLASGRAWHSKFQEMTNAAAAASPKANGRKSRCIVDGRTGLTDSIHQKFMVTSISGELTSIVGGIDVTYARWDTMSRTEDEKAARIKYGLEEPTGTKGLLETSEAATEGRGGWLDRSVNLKGPSAACVANNFVERWNDPETPLEHSGIGLGDLVENNNWENRPANEPLATESSQPQRGTHNVQILRTEPCNYGCILGMGCNTYPYAPKGELSIQKGMQKAIKTAKNYIYIEDQYGMYVKDVQLSLFEALKNGLAHLVVLVAPALEKSNGNALYMMNCAGSQYDMWFPLKNAYPDRVRIYERNDAVFIHSKTWLIDDVWFMTGSANLNERSMTVDPEINAAVVDSTTEVSADGITVNKFGLDARATIFYENTLVPEETLRSLKFVDALNMFDTAPNRRVNRLDLSTMQSFAINAAQGVCQDARKMCRTTPAPTHPPTKRPTPRPTSAPWWRSF